MYKQNEKYIEYIDKLANEAFPIVPLSTSGEDKDLQESLFITVRSASANRGFITGYERALSDVKNIIEKLDPSMRVTHPIKSFDEIFEKLLNG